MLSGVGCCCMSLVVVFVVGMVAEVAVVMRCWCLLSLLLLGVDCYCALVFVVC